MGHTMRHVEAQQSRSLRRKIRKETLLLLEKIEDKAYMSVTLFASLGFYLSSILCSCRSRELARENIFGGLGAARSE